MSATTAENLFFLGRGSRGIGMIPIVSLFLLCAGCTAEMVATRRRVAGPVKEVGMIDPGGGELQYPVGIWDWVNNTRRQDALMKMEGYCGGKQNYKVVDEVDRKTTDVPYSQEDDANELSVLGKKYPRHTVHHIYFECIN